MTYNPAVQLIREGGNPACYDLLAYGAVPDGGADATQAVQAAVNGASNGVHPGEVCAPAGRYVVRQTITVKGGIRLTGSGTHITTHQTTFLAATRTLDPVFLVNSDDGVLFQNFVIAALSHAAPQTAGALIRLRGSTPGVTFNEYSKFINVGFEDEFVGLDLVDATTATVTGCIFDNAQSVGLQIDNPINPDAGDHVVTGNWFEGSSVANAVGMLHKGSGGLRVTNNKFQPYATGGAAYRFAWASAATGSSQLMINNNDFEFGVGSEIDFAR